MPTRRPIRRQRDRRVLPSGLQESRINATASMISLGTNGNFVFSIDQPLIASLTIPITAIFPDPSLDPPFAVVASIADLVGDVWSGSFGFFVGSPCTVIIGLTSPASPPLTQVTITGGALDAAMFVGLIPT